MSALMRILFRSAIQVSRPSGRRSLWAVGAAAGLCAASFGAASHTSTEASAGPDITARRAIAAAEEALRVAESDRARNLLAPHLSDAGLAVLSRPTRIQVQRLAGDVEFFASRGSEAEKHYMLALGEAQLEPAVHADEIVRSRVGLARQTQLLSEGTVAEAHIRMAERHLAAASDEGRATYLEGVARMLVTSSCRFPCPISLNNFESSARQALGFADDAVALRRRLRPGSEGSALSLRALSWFRTQGATREELVQGQADLLESIRLLSLSGSRFQLAEALRIFTYAMENSSGLRPSDLAATEAASTLLPEGSSWTRWRLALEIARRTTTKESPGNQWSCVALETAEEMSRFIRPSRESRSGWANQHMSAYFFGASFALDLQGAEAALRTVERLRGRVLATVIAGRREARPGAPPDPSRDALLAEHRRLSRRTLSPDGTLDPAVLTRLWELGALLDAPHLRASLTPPPDRLTDEIPPGALLVYFPYTTRNFLALSHGGEVKILTHELEYHELWPLVARLRRLLADPGSDTASLTEIASTLYDALLGSLDEDIVRAKRLIIVADGNLEQIPFSALLRVRGRDARFLGAWKPISNVLSLSVRRELARRLEAPRDGGVAIFADPRNPAYEELPDAAREGAQIAAGWGGAARLYVGKAATRDTLFRELSRARVVHLATHAVSNVAFALATGLVVAPDGPDDDGLLRAWELIHYPPVRADLVVLSGCETGPGSEWFANGEGSFDLSRHFLEAGAGAVLAASWRISDEATAVFMTRFHEELRAGASPDTALQRTQAALSSSPRWAHPFNWAAFRLVGLGGD